MLQAIIQGIIQGLTEFLPVSSSGHLALYQYFTKTSGESAALFSLVLHLGTLIAVFVAFWDSISGLIAECFAFLGDCFRKKNPFHDPQPRRRMLFLLAVSLLPLFLTLLVKDRMEAVASDNSIVAEGVCFLITGALLFLADSCVGGHVRAGRMSYRGALAIGVMQAIAPLPGISRSGSTLSIGILLGLERSFAMTFSFLMGIPAVLGALLLDAKEIASGGLGVSAGVVLAGLVTSAVFGLLAIRLVRWLVASRHLKWFSYYTLTLGLIVLVIGLIDTFAGYPVQNAVSALLS
jgi:undecaprenyl-diphosphatase